MAGEMSASEVTREEHPLHFALADILCCEVRPFDQYQGPYVASAQGRIFLSYDGYVCRWLNEQSGEQSHAFLLSSDLHDIENAVRSASSIVTFPEQDRHFISGAISDNPIHVWCITEQSPRANIFVCRRELPGVPPWYCGYVDFYEDVFLDGTIGTRGIVQHVPMYPSITFAGIENGRKVYGFDTAGLHPEEFSKEEFRDMLIKLYHGLAVASEFESAYNSASDAEERDFVRCQYLLQLDQRIHQLRPTTDIENFNLGFMAV